MNGDESSEPKMALPGREHAAQKRETHDEGMLLMGYATDACGDCAGLGDNGGRVVVVVCVGCGEIERGAVCAVHHSQRDDI